MVGVALALTFWAQTSPSRIQLSEREVRAKLTKREAAQVQYPEEAKQKGIQGVVRIHIVVGRNGSVKQLDVVQGDPVLAKRQRRRFANGSLNRRL